MNFIFILGVFLFLVFSFIFYHAIIKPLKLLSFYRNQGIKMDFFPLGGFWYQGMVDTKKHGDFFYSFKQIARSSPKPRLTGSNLGTGAFLNFIDPELAKEFFTHHELYTKPSNLLGLFRLLLNDGLAFSDGKQWKRHRKYSSLAFRFDLIKDMVPEIADLVQDFYKNLTKNNLDTVNILHQNFQLTGDIIGSVFFGERFTEKNIKGKNVTKTLVDTGTKISLTTFEPLTMLFGVEFVKKGFFPSHKQLLRDIKELRDWGAELIARKMADIAKDKEKNIRRRKTLFEIYQDQRTESDEAFTDLEIIDEFLTFFLAGVETTSHTVARAIYLLETNPLCKKKALEEVERVLSGTNTITLEVINKLEYIQGCLKEALRLQIPTPFIFIREALQDHQIGDIKVKKGTYASTVFCCNSNDPNIHEDPEEFNPSRWLDPNSLTSKSTLNPYVFTPFSAGPRNCIGQHLALIQGRLILAFLLKNFEIRLKDEKYKPALTLTFMYHPVVEPEYILRKRL